VNNGIPFYRGQEISLLLERKSIGEVIYINEKKYASLKARYGAPQRGEILITAVGTLGNSFLIDTDEPFYFKDGNLIWAKNIKGISPDFLIRLLQYNKAELLASAIGSSQKALTMVALSPIKFSIPSAEEEQLIIAKILSEIDSDIQTYECRLSKTRQIKQGMMQELLTGRTRLIKPKARGVEDAA
jgi:type I restriction enzyme S subunit